jgi:hypothetical protein
MERAETRLAVFDMTQVGQRFEGPGAQQKLGYKLLTLTTRTPSSPQGRFDPCALRERVSVMRGLFRRFWRRTDWGRQVRDLATGRKRSRRDTGFILALEIGPGGNVHLHVLVYGEYVPQAILQDLWTEVVGEKLAIVDIRAARDRAGALRYILKYLLKGARNARPFPELAAAVEYALRRVRRVEIVGAFRTAGGARRTGEDVSPAEVSEARNGACEACGKVGSWKWDGRVPPEHVAVFGGFGLIRPLKMDRDPDVE